MNMVTSPHLPFAFDGTFDARTRQALKTKRQSLGVSLQQLGDFLEIHWSTVRKWEAGITASCHPRHIARVAKFLRGGYDASLRALSDPEYARKQNSSLRLAPSSAMPLAPLWSPKLETSLECTIERAIHNAFEDMRKAFLAKPK
ncbi:MAG: helix-turn-helix transcriptional regulator [Victivallales bacterium]|nr:helix-turn-helix transcriptional regulator [Victivallales bacterium]